MKGIERFVLFAVLLLFVVGLFAGEATLPSKAPLIVVSGYEYPYQKAVAVGKLQHLYINHNHDNKTVPPGGSVANIAAFPYGEKMLLVATVNTDVVKDATGIRWSFMETARKYYGGKPGVEVSVIKAAGVPDNQIHSSADQIVTQLGVTPVYPPLPQVVKGLKVTSGEPVDKIDIASNQSWIIVRSFEPGVSKVLVSVVTGKNVVTPEVEYAVNWIGKYKPLCNHWKLEVNVVDTSPDPYVFRTSEDQFINYKITVEDKTDYYQNPAGVLPILYADIPFTLRFRVDPLQQGSDWPDAYWVDWGTADTTIALKHYTNRSVAKYAHTTYEQRVVYKHGVLTPTVNGAKPEAALSYNAYLVFYPYNPDPHFYYYHAKERSVEAAVAYSHQIGGSRSYWDINDESTTIEYQPNENMGGLQVTWDIQNSPDPSRPVHLVNTGGRIYEIFGESPGGGKWLILAYLDAGSDAWVQADHGDWINYHTITNNNTDSCREPVIAKQIKVRVQ